MKKSRTFVISFSAEINELSNNKLFDPEVASKYPGAYWPLEVKKILENYICVTADVALEMVLSGTIISEDVLVIQHNMDSFSRHLITLGAVPFFITIFESPLYAPNFYKKLNEIEKKFHNSLIFCSLNNETNKRRAVRFPSFSIKKIEHKSEIPWDARKFACVVIGNKYVPLQKIMEQQNFSDFLWLLIMRLKKILRQPKELIPFELKNNQLQDKRIELIIYFLERNLLDLYGKRWEALWTIPPKYRVILKKLLRTRKITAPSDKLEVLQNYKFNFCFENVSYPGYITEKIFDAIFSKTIPVYWGSHDIADFVPSDIFIDASKFNSYEDLLIFMEKINLEDAKKMIASGQKFLNSALGRQFSYEENAKYISQKVLDFPKESY